MTESRWIAHAIVVAQCCIIVGCRDVKTISSMNSASPSGGWVAVAMTDQYGGPGNAGIITTVSLKRTLGRQDSAKILELSQDAPSIDLKLTWTSSSHLEITYVQPASVDFEAIKCGGVDITVRDISDKPANLGRVPTE